MSTNFIGQTRKQKRNCEEQQRRRKSIKERFPKTVTFHTYEDIDEKIARRQMKIAKAFEIVGEKIRQAEVKSLAITYYIYIHARKEKLRILRQIYRYAGEENMTLDKLLKLLDKNVPLKKRNGIEKSYLLIYSLGMKEIKNSELGKISEIFTLFVPQLSKRTNFSLS